MDRESPPRNRAVFLDRDGTLCEDVGYLSRWEDFKVFSDVNELTSLKSLGFKLIGITNQSGIARGIVREDFVREVNGVFMKQYGFDGFYYCPHHPDEGCRCRKPRPEMALRARGEHGLDLKTSYVIGDKEADMLLARAIGATGVLVLTGEARESEAASFRALNLKEAVDFILDKEKRPDPAF
jgi:heptosyltransferase-2